MEWMGITFEQWMNLRYTVALAAIPVAIILCIVAWRIGKWKSREVSKRLHKLRMDCEDRAKKSK